MLLVGKQSFTTGASMDLFKSVVVFLAVIAICGCDRGQPTPPVATNNTPVVDPSPVPPPSVEPSTPIPNPTPATTDNPTPVELPESANSIGMEFKLIPAGRFTMGQGDESHEVTLTEPFQMGVHEVTQAQYEQVMGSNPSIDKGAENPVDPVSWDDAVQFCRQLSELPAEKAAGNVYRLPTEAQWEYACRAGTTTTFSFGDDNSVLGDYAWFTNNSSRNTHPVGSKKPNAWGLYDMHGNVWEWCSDWYGKDYYESSPTSDPTGPSGGSLRVSRGGSWDNTADYCRAAYRARSSPSFRANANGFRVVRSSEK